MTRQAEAAETPAELDKKLAAQSAKNEALIEKAGGDSRKAVGALLVQLAEIERARAEAMGATSLGYRRGLMPARPARSGP